MDRDLAGNSISELRDLGFEGFLSVGDLQRDCSGVPEDRGIYLVLRVKGNPPVFLARGTGGSFKGRDPNVSISQLQSEWIRDTAIVYIGQTGKSLKRRISRLMEFGKGMPVAHYGGRYIWQIQDHKDLIVCWKPCPDGFDPRQIEHELLLRFRTRHGRLPFANLRD